LRDQSGPILAAHTPRSASLMATDVYAGQLDAVEEVIARTIVQNLPGRK